MKIPRELSVSQLRAARRGGFRRCLLRGPEFRLGTCWRSGFSLIEMLVSLALMIILMVMWHGFGSRSNQQRQKTACAKNLQTIYLALEIFAGENEGRFPQAAHARTSEEPLSLLVPRYTVASDTFICPGSKDSRIPSAAPLERHRISYAYFMGRTLSETGAVLMSDKWIDTQPKSKGDLLFSSNGKAPGNNHHRYGGNFLFADGEVRSSQSNAPFALNWPPGVVLLNPK